MKVWHLQCQPDDSKGKKKTQQGHGCLNYPLQISHRGSKVLIYLKITDEPRPSFWEEVIYEYLLHQALCVMM